MNRRLPYVATWAVVVCVCRAAPAGNLLTNPGFEERTGDQPKGWSLYLMPREGAEGRLAAETASEGTYSVFLRVPPGSENEVINNWSQNVIADLGGKELLVRGMIKTEEAVEAAIWIQCFRKRPFAVLRANTSSTDAAIWGTRDWTPVEMRVRVPEDADFITCRCVLKGSGAAWFDAMEVDDAAPVPDDADVAQTPEDGEAPDKAQDAGGERDGAVREAVIASQHALIEANRALRETNRILAAQVAALEGEVHALRERVLSLQERNPLVIPQAPPVAAPSTRMPPFVPHGRLA
ncbi:MAG TPA: hypothetical protein HPP77_11475, partial [Candidatus Hydrogenedentes bacterium]|nr:hypothetical protein [Candidatus Hydrogenedentota bacterium]